MKALEFSVQLISITALDASIRASVPSFLGLSTGVGIPSIAYMQDSVTPAEEASVGSLLSAHDPVFISTDKAVIYANGIDTATISVSAPKAGAAGVTLVITQLNNDGVVIQTITQAVTMFGGAGTVQFKTQIYGTYTVAVQNGSNRCADTFSIQAV